MAVELTENQQDMLKRVDNMGKDMDLLLTDCTKIGYTDMRFLSIAKTDLQRGFMELKRGIINPKGF